MSSRPNILFLLADDWMYPHASCLGDPAVKTPTFDRLAREGVQFRNAYAAAPSCTPSRAAALTGQWQWRLKQGASLYGFLPHQFETYPDILETAGYFVGLTGKGWAPGTAHFDGRTRNPAGPHFKNFDAFLAARPKGRPFCFWFGSTDPHRPYSEQLTQKSGLDPAKVVVPPYLPDNDEVRRDICDYYAEVERFDRQAGELISALERIGELDHTLVVMSGDNGWPFPRAKATVYEFGTHVPLAIRWGEKNKPGRVVDDFVSLSDLAPTFLDAAGLTPPKTMTARSLMPLLLSDKSGWIDPARDHVLTGMERHSDCRRADGLSLGYPMRAIRTARFHYIRNFKPDRWPAGNPPKESDASAKDPKKRVGYGDVDYGPTKLWMLERRGDAEIEPLFHLAFEKRPDRELYDLEKDPHQMHNAAFDPAYAPVVERLDARLMAELSVTGDPRAAGGGDEFDRYPYTVSSSRDKSK